MRTSIITLPNTICIRVIKLYQKTLSPDTGVLRFWLKGRVCSHTPHCSQYAVECLERYGILTALEMIIERVSGCVASSHPHYDPSAYRVVFFCSAAIGIPFGERLVQDKHFELVGVVTQPPQASGRGMVQKDNIISTTALQQRGLSDDQITTPERIHPDKSETGRQFAQRLSDLQPDYIVVIAYGKIIPQAILDIPKIASINVHGSDLPLYRGASPIQSSILHNASHTAVTIMQMAAGLDTGDILSKSQIPLSLTTTTADLIATMCRVGPPLLANTLIALGKGHLQAQPQDHSKATTTSKMIKSDGLVELQTESLESLYHKYRAYILRPKVHTRYHHHGVITPMVIEKIVVDEALREQYKGEMSMNRDNQLNPAIQQLIVKPAGKKSMTWQDWMRGHQLK